MPKKTALVDYEKCDPERCESGVCAAVLECEYRHLFQEHPYDPPEINPARWCHACADCVVACPLKAILMM